MRCPAFAAECPPEHFMRSPIYVDYSNGTAQREGLQRRPILRTTFCRNSRSPWFPVSRLGAPNIFDCRMRPAWTPLFAEWIASMLHSSNLLSRLRNELAVLFVY